MKIKVSEATNPQLNWLVATIEGYKVGVMTAADVIGQQLKGKTDPNEIEWIKEAFAAFKPKPCFVAEDGYKSEYSAKLSNRGISGKIEFVTDPAQAWPIIDREGISTIRADDDYGVDEHGFCNNVRIPVWCATKGQHGTTTSTEHQHHEEMFQICVSEVVYGPNPLIAAMRCWITSRMGDEVEIPDELVSA